MSAAPMLLEMRGIGKRFPGVVALEGVDLELCAGEVHALVGENGAGKTTLIKILSGALEQDRGTILLDGRELRSADPRATQQAGIAAIHQELTRIPGLSVAENLLLGREPRRAWGIDARAMRARARAALARLSLDLDVDLPLGSFSYATQQRVAIARALDLDARVLILDEPTASLDREQALALLFLLERLKHGGLAVVFIGHRLDEILSVADRISVLRNGRKIGTFARASVTKLELVTHMLGREPSASRRAVRVATDSPQRPLLLEARNLIGPGLAAPCDLVLREGEVLGVAGLLGSGRSDLVQLLSGARRRSSGEVTLAGKCLPAGDIRAAVDAGVGCSPEERQSDALLPDLSVLDNLLLVVSRSFAWRRPAVERAVAEGLAQRLRIVCADLDQPVRLLSGGNQQKVILARWLAAHPRALLLDEPTRGVDVGAREEIESFVARLAEQGMAVLLVSSDLDEVLSASERILVLHARRAVAELCAAELTEDAVLEAMAGALEERKP
ncbi:MAG: sugar ABC transporter ATP-binding protein [Planctomycetota bacterium]